MTSTSHTVLVAYLRESADKVEQWAEEARLIIEDNTRLRIEIAELQWNRNKTTKPEPKA